MMQTVCDINDMKETHKNVEIVTAQVHDKSYWEKLGVRFKQTETIGMSVDGQTSEPYLTWVAIYRGKFIATGGTKIDSMMEWMDKKHEFILARMEKLK